MAASANAGAYDEAGAGRYVDGAPHIKHLALRRLYREIVVNVYDAAKTHTSRPKVLDLGAGEGSVTLPFLELGAEVTAVDVSERQLRALESRCSKHSGRLVVRCQDAFDAMREIQTSQGGQYDIVVANSFLHHVPDYLALIRQAAAVLSPHGQFFSFQDPLRYDSLGRFTDLFSKLAYVSWRVLRGDVIGGIKRRLRRARGVYLDNCPQDRIEYHFTRGGVDQDAIRRLFAQLGFDCHVIRYFSTQGRLAQWAGAALGIANTFAILAKRGV